MVPGFRQSSAAVSRLFSWGSLPVDALRQVLSFPFLTRNFHKTLGDEGYTSPALISPGGAFTDNEGSVGIRVSLYNAKPMNFIDSFLYSETYYLPEEETGRHRSRATAVGLSGTNVLNTGDLSAPGTSVHNNQVPQVLSLGLGQRRTNTDTLAVKQLRGTFGNRKTHYLAVRAGLMVHLTVSASNTRWRTAFGSMVTPELSGGRRG